LTPKLLNGSVQILVSVWGLPETVCIIILTFLVGSNFGRQ